MKKFTVYVTGTLDDDFEIEADDQYEAISEAEELFIRRHDILWSGVQAYEAEEIKDES